MFGKWFQPEAIFFLKMHEKAFGQQASPDPAGEGELTALTKPIAGKKGRSGR